MFGVSEWHTEITVFEKVNGVLTKRIALVGDKLVSDSSSCRMANGFARRVRIDDMQAFANLINNFTSSEAYALGRLKDTSYQGDLLICVQPWRISRKSGHEEHSQRIVNFPPNQAFGTNVADYRYPERKTCK